MFSRTKNSNRIFASVYLGVGIACIIGYFLKNDVMLMWLGIVLIAIAAFRLFLLEKKLAA